jgi:hypothetical protein
VVNVPTVDKAEDAGWIYIVNSAKFGTHPPVDRLASSEILSCLDSYLKEAFPVFYQIFSQTKTAGKTQIMQAPALPFDFGKATSASPTKQQTKTKSNYFSPYGTRSQTKAKAATPLQSLVATAAPAAVRSIVPTSQGPNSSQDWHNLLTSGLLSSDLEDPTDFDDTPVPNATPPQTIVEDGVTAQWVDLATFISYVQKNASLANPSITPSGLTDQLTGPLQSWYGSGSTNPVFASMILQALIGADDAVEFYSKSLIHAFYVVVYSYLNDIRLVTTQSQRAKFFDEQSQCPLWVGSHHGYDSSELQGAYRCPLASPIRFRLLYASSRILFRAHFSTNGFHHGI